MKTYTFNIKKKFPSLNEYINTCRANRYKGNEMKKKWEAEVIKILAESGIHFESQVGVTFVFYESEKGHKRDLDNISGFAHKVILDAMKEAKVIVDDNPKYVFCINDFYNYTPYDHEVMVTVTERAD